MIGDKKLRFKIPCLISPKVSAEAKDKSEIRDMKRTLKYCGVEEVEISELETKHGKWNRQAWGRAGRAGHETV